MSEAQRTPELNLEQEFEEAYQWLLRDPHVRESRAAQENPQFHEAVCRAAAAVITLVNAQGRQPFPDGSWEADRGVHKAGNGYRAAVTVHVQSLRKMLGRRDIPRADQITAPDSRTVTPYITVIWQRESEADEFSKDRITADNLVTAFPSQVIDQVRTTIARQDYAWKLFGEETKAAELRRQIAERFGA